MAGPRSVPSGGSRKARRLTGIGGGDQDGGLSEGQGVQAFFDAVKGRHGTERVLGDMESLRGGVKRKRPR